jgi:N-acetylneuraminate lyase
MGADGAIGSTFNFMADLFVRIQKLFGEGKKDEAFKVQGAANEVIAVLVQVGVYPGVKAALRMQGFDVGDCRRPFARLTAEHEARLAAALENLR